MRIIKSSSQKSLAEVLMFSWVGTIWLVVISSLILAVMNITVIYSFVYQNTYGNPDVSQADLSVFFENHAFSRWSYSHNPILAQLSTLIFWCFIGAVVFMVIWAFQNVKKRAEEVKESTRLLHPRWYDADNFWSSVLAHSVFLISSLLVTVIFLYATLSFLLPLWRMLFSQIFFHTSYSVARMQLGLAIVGMSITIYIFIMLVRTITYCWQILRI